MIQLFLTKSTSETMYNGVKDDAGSSAAWERPWSTEEMRKQSPRWNLAGDAGLLEFLQDFSQRMISRTHEVEQMVNTLCHETKVTNAKVSNIVNDFHMLSNTQFVESRVYDEDIPEPVKEEKKLEKTKQERENEVVGKISNALNLGLSVMEEAFERVEIQQDSDSEDEDSPVHRQILLQPKDPYLQRPLPHLIGTKAFLDDEYVGIGDFSEEEDERIEKEESEVSSEDDSIPEEKPNLAQKLRDEYESESLSGGSDMFQENDTHDGKFDESSSDTSDDNEDLLRANGKDETDKANQPPPLLAEQLDAKIKQYVRNKSSKNNNSRKSSDTQSIRSRQSIRSISKNIPKAPSEEDLFGAAIPSEEDELFGRKGGLFSGTGKMFDESQENSGLFDDVSKPEKEVVPENEEKLLTPRSRGYTKSGKKIPAGAISIVGGDSVFEEKGHKIFNPSQPTVKQNTVAEPATEKILITKNNPPPSKKKTTGGLFDSDDNDDDDLFSNPQKQKPSISSPTTKGNKSEPSIRSGSLFFSDDENENDLFGVPKNETIKNVPIKAAKKAPIGGVSVFGSLAGEIGTAIKSKRPKEDSDSEKSEDLSETRDTTSIKSQSSFQASKKILSKDSRSNSVSSNSLFADDPEIDDLFTKKEETTKPTTKTATSLFKDNLEENDDFDSLFSATKPVAKGESSQPSVPVKSASQTAKSLFEDIDEDDLFSIASKPAPSKTKTFSSLSVSEDDGLKNLLPVITKDEPKKLESKKELPKVKEITPAPKISLFDDNQDEDLFSVSSKLSQSPASMDSKSPEIPKSPETSKLSEPTKVRSTSLFDDDVLFGGPNEESPEIDLFKSAASDKNNKATPEPVEKKPISNTVSPSKKPIGGVALFGGVDLFAGASSLKPVAAIEEQSDKTEDDAGESATNYQSEIRRRAPLLKDTKEISVSFDDPIDTSNTLQSAVKDRVKVQTKRRPPSRKGRLAAASKSGIDIVTEPKEDKEIKVNFPESSLQQESKEPSLVKPKEKNISNKPTPFLAVTADFRSPSTEEEDLFSVMDLPDKTLLSNTREKVKKPSPPTKIVVEEPIETDGDLFGSNTNPPVSVEPVNDVISAQKDAKPQNLFKKCNKPPPKNQSLFGDDDEDDDIFSVSNTKKESKLPQSKVSKDTVDSSGSNKSNAKDIFGDDSDDIFKSVPSNTDKKLPKLSSMSKSIFDDDTDDDSDIFAPKTSGTSSSTKTISTGKQSTTLSGKRKESLVKKTVKHSTDVFDDPLLGGQSDKD